MPWMVRNHDAFDAEYDAMPDAVQDELLAVTGLLELYGPRLGRPHADTLGGSRHANMKELRFNADGGAWLLRSTRNGKQSCWSLATRQEWRRSGFTRR